MPKRPSSGGNRLKQMVSGRFPNFVTDYRQLPPAQRSTITRKLFNTPRNYR